MNKISEFFHYIDLFISLCKVCKLNDLCCTNWYYNIKLSMIGAWYSVINKSFISYLIKNYYEDYTIKVDLCFRDIVYAGIDRYINREVFMKSCDPLYYNENLKIETIKQISNTAYDISKILYPNTGRQS